MTMAIFVAILAGKTVKAYDEAVTILKDLGALALHRQQWEEFVRRVEGIRGRYSRLSALQWRIENANLVEVTWNDVSTSSD